MIDVRGDLANLQYGQSNKWNVPLYYLFGSGSIVGHDPDVKIDRQLSNEKQIKGFFVVGSTTLPCFFIFSNRTCIHFASVHLISLSRKHAPRKQPMCNLSHLWAGKQQCLTSC